MLLTDSKSQNDTTHKEDLFGWRAPQDHRADNEQETGSENGPLTTEATIEEARGQ